MKKTTKLLSVILALVMMLSTVSVAFAGTLNVTKETTVASLITNDNLAVVIGNLLDDLNGAKKNIAGTVLKFCFMFIDPLKEAAGSQDVTKLSDEQLAKLLMDWLDTFLNDEFGDVLPKEVTDIGNLLGLTIKLDSVDGILGTLNSACDLSNGILDLGILNKLNGSAVKGVKRSGGDLNVIYALLQWLSDNKGALQKAAKGNLDLGIVGDFVDVSEYEGIIKNVPDFLTAYIYLLVDGYADKPDIKDDPKGGWGRSDYASFNADELLAAALLKLIKNDKEAVISKTEAKAATEKTVYALLAENLDDLFANFKAAEWLNENVPAFVNGLCVTDDIKAVFNSKLEFTNDTFKDIFAGAADTGVLGQVNNLLYKIGEIALKPAEFKKLALVKGDNTNLNENLKKVCQYILPLMANDTVSKTLGYDFTAFTAEAVQKMELKDMAVAILKLFFEDWFSNANKIAVADTKTLEQLGALAVYYTATNPDWLPFTVDAEAPAASLLDRDRATAYILDTGALIGLNALKYNADKIYFPGSDATGYEAIAKDVSNWGLNFIKGLPAVAVTDDLCNTTKGDAFYKVNVIVNELIDFSFFTNDKGGYDNAPTTFKFDLGLFLSNTLLDNIYNFDVEGILNAFKKNSAKGNILNQATIPAVLSVADRAVTALFKHTDDTASAKAVTATKETCYDKTVFTAAEKSYDFNSGRYLTAPTVTTTAFEKPNHKQDAATMDVSNQKGKDCKTKGVITYKCAKCGETLTKDGQYGDHAYEFTKTVTPTCAEKGYDVRTCTVCKATENYNEVPATGKHTYENGVCTVCGAKDPDYKPFTLYDVDNNGKIEAADARLALRGSVGLKDDGIDFSNTSGINFLAADADGNGKIEAADARSILRVSVGLSAD